MRSLREYAFRVRQELTNLALLARSDARVYDCGTSLAGLPPAAAAVSRLRNQPIASQIVRLAESVLRHQFPVAGHTFDTGADIDWRRDYASGTRSDLRYFRRVPYLDFAKVGDHKAIWDLNRHQHLVLLAQAFLFTENPAFLDEIEGEIKTWIEQNPFMRGINWTSALEVAFRALSWVWVLHLVGDRLEEDAKRQMLRAIMAHGRYIAANLSVYFAPNTHLLGEVVALHALGTLLPFPECRGWRERGDDLVHGQMAMQIRDDGSHFEQSSYYHLYACDMLVFHRLLCRTATPEYDSTLSAMARYLAALMGPCRSLPLLGDDDGGRMFHPYGRCEHFGRATLATCSLLLKETRWPYDDQDIHEQAAWWLGGDVASSVSPGECRVTESQLFRDAGLAAMVSGSTAVLMDAGPFGRGPAGHSHSDTLSVVVRDGCDELLGDAGTYTYVGDPRLRNWFRGSAAHNTVRLDQRDQAQPAGPFRWTDTPAVTVLEWVSTPEADVIDATCHYAGLERFVHRRRVMLLKSQYLRRPLDVILVLDHVDGLAGGHVVEQYWHPGIPYELGQANRVYVGTRCQLLFPLRTEVEPEPQFRSPVFGQKHPSSAIVVRRKAMFPVTLTAVIAVGELENLRSLEMMADADADLAVDLGDGRVVTVRLEPHGARYQIQPREK